MADEVRDRAGDAGTPAVSAPDWRKGVRGALWETREAWSALTVYERFEQIVSVTLTLIIGSVIVAAVVQLVIRIPSLILSGMIDPTDQTVFQTIFSMILTVLIALEFNHSLVSVLKRKKGVVKVRTVILIALLALVYKFMLIDAARVSPMTLVGLAVAVLALGIVFLLLRAQEE